MRPTVRDHVIKIAQERAIAQITASPEWLRVAAWLRGDKEKLQSLIELVQSRIEKRGEMGVPRTSHETVVVAGMDQEARQLIAILSAIFSLPVNTPIEGATDE